MKTLNVLRALMIWLLLVMSPCFVSSQTNYEFPTPQELAVQYLVEPGAVVSNVSFFGDSLQFAHLTGLADMGFEFGLSSAVCMSNSVAPGLLESFDYPPFLPDISAYTPPWFSGPMYSNDDPAIADLLNVSQQTMDLLGYDFVDTIAWDAAWIEFDVLATSNSLSFSYILSGSEFSRSAQCIHGEDSWSYAGDCYFHDAFAIFVSGPDITGPFSSPPQFQGSVNVAHVPGTNPILPLNTESINDTINGNLWIDYMDNYYEVNGCDFENPCEIPPALRVAGFSQLLTNSIDVTCGQVYHVRIAMADIFDHIYESFWMLAPIGGTANGTQNPEVNISFVPQGEMTNHVFEDCNPAWLNVTRSGIIPVNSPDTVSIYPDGIAQPGLDYDLLPEYIVIPAGQQTLSIPIYIADDDIDEGEEILIISILEAHNLNQDCAVSAYVQINDGPDPLLVSADEVMLCTPASTTLQPVVEGGYGQYTYQWFNGSVESSIELSYPDPDDDYYVIVGDTCGIESDTVWFELNDLELLALQFSTDTIDFSCNESMQISAEVTGGYGEIQYSWSPYNSTSDEPLYYFNSADGPQTVYLQVIDECNQILTDSVFMFSPYELPFGYYGENVIYAGCEDVFEFEPLLDGGIDPYFVYFVSGMDFQAGMSAEYILTDTTLVTLLATDACGQNYFTTVTIIPFSASPLGYDLPDWLPVSCTGTTEVEIVVNDGYGNITYEWTNDQNLVVSEDDIWIYTGIAETMVYVTAMDECGQFMLDSVHLTDFTIPLEISVADTITFSCAETVSLDVNIVSGQGPFEVSWIHDGEILGEGSVLTNLVFLESTWLEVFVVDACSQMQSAEIYIHVDALPLLIEPLQDIELSCGDVLEMSILVEQSNGQYSTEWWVNGELISDSDDLFVNDISDSLNVEVIVEDECFQEWEQSIHVTVNAGVLSLELPDELQINCTEDVLVQPVVSSESDYAPPQWYVNGQYYGDGDFFNYGEPFGAWIFCEVEGECGNVASDSVWVNVNAAQLSVALQDTTVCAGSTVELSAIIEGGNGQITVFWNDVEGGLTSEFVVEGNEEVWVTVSDECGITSSDMAEILAVDLNPQIIIEELPGSFLLNVVDECMECVYIWTFPDGTTYHGTTVHCAIESGLPGNVMLDVSNGSCPWNGSWYLQPKPMIYVPNAFTPDGDGLNDEFKVISTGYEKFEIWVLSRWGDVVFHSANPDDAWTGNSNDGSYYVGDGVYTWRIEVFEIDGASRVFHGTVVLIR